MKLSNLLIASLLVASTGAQSQEKSPLKPVKKDSIKVIKAHNEVGTPTHRLTVPSDTLKCHSDTNKTQVPTITKDYCPPCGMG